MNGKLRIAAAGLAALLCAGVSMAETPEGKGWKKDGMSHGEGRFDKMKSELGLSDEQAQKLKAHKEAQMAQGKALWDEMKTKREALRAELEKEKVDESRVKALNGELKALQNKMADQRIAAVLEVRKILTPEQFKKFHERMEERREDRQEKREDRQERRKERRENMGGEELGTPKESR